MEELRPGQRQIRPRLSFQLHVLIVTLATWRGKEGKKTLL